LADAAREPFLSYSREEYPDYYKYLIETFARIKAKPRIVEEYDGFSGLIAAVEAGTGVALVGTSFGVVAGPRVKLLRLTPEPEPSIIGIAAPKGRLAAAAETFWQCAVRAAARY
jgi:DNA-binding transcriptional LysR family regulator